MTRAHPTAVAVGNRPTPSKPMTRPEPRIRRRALPALAVLTASLALGVSGASAATGGLPDRSGTNEKEENHCISPTGVDLNERYGVSAQIVLPFCNQVGAGERWTVGVLWSMAPTFAVVPAGFVSLGATPLEDFKAKFAAVKYVVDPGTWRERTHVFPNNRRLWTGTLDGFPSANSLTLGLLKPLPVGEHLVDVYWVFNAMHCDGIGDVIAAFSDGGNCLAAGEHKVWSLPLEVTPRRVRH